MSEAAPAAAGAPASRWVRLWVALGILLVLLLLALLLILLPQFAGLLEAVPISILLADEQLRMLQYRAQPAYVTDRVA